MNIKAIVDLIESKSKGKNKQLEASIHGIFILAPPYQKPDVTLVLKPSINQKDRLLSIHIILIYLKKKKKLQFHHSIQNTL